MIGSLLILLLCSIWTCFGAPSNAYFAASAKLHPNCLKLEPTPDLSLEWGMQLFAGAHFYIPFGSSQALHRISNLISGKGADTEVAADGMNGADGEGLSKLCALVRIKGFKLQMEGHGEHFMIQDCAVVKKGVNHCTVNQRSENPEVQEQGDGIFTIVWTDNESTMVIVRCANSGLFNDWYVFSTQTSLNDTVKSEILSTMTKLGFQDTLQTSSSPSYQDCKLFDPDDED